MNKHIVTGDEGKPFHSNGYARVLNGDRIGATDNVSFNQRLQIERSRQLVGGYHRSALGNSYGALRAKAVIKDVSNRSGIIEKPSLQQFNAQVEKPKPQSYNPFA